MAFSYSMGTPHARLRATISSRVQGVNFRYSTLERARALGLTGWVRNRRDGAVEAEAEGPRPALEALLEYLHHGPRHAAVEAVQAEWLDATGQYADFEVRG
jgi:acylphosphatase